MRVVEATDDPEAAHHNPSRSHRDRNENCDSDSDRMIERVAEVEEAVGVGGIDFSGQ